MSVAASRPLPRPAGGEGGRVLVADDQPAVREALRLLLKPHGYDVRAVGLAQRRCWRRWPSRARGSTCW